jgi:type IV fimbrial biogenesis protein FimT
METFMKNERLTTQINTLLAHLQYARSEAVTRHAQVVVCASSDAATCGGGWDDGWIVFADLDSDGDMSAGDERIRAQQKLEGDNTLASSAGATIIFDNRGFSPNSSGTFTLQDDRGAAYEKTLTISNTGRVRYVP